MEWKFYESVNNQKNVKFSEYQKKKTYCINIVHFFIVTIQLIGLIIIFVLEISLMEII
jgi:hypothetical protein